MDTAGYLLLVLLVVDLSERIESSFSKDSFRTDEFSKASCDFALDLLKAAESDEAENVLLSPSSISVLLAILQQGASGTTASQLEKVVHLSAEESKIGYGRVIKSLERDKRNLTLEWGNRGYVVPGFDLEEHFLKTVEENFNATIKELNFTMPSPAVAAAQINDWVKEATHDNIKDLVDASLLTPDTVMLMVNAIFFKSVWNSPFQKLKTRNDKFQVSNDHKIEVPFMRQAGKFIAGEDTDLGIMWTELPFREDNFSMIFILPIKPNDLNQVVKKLTGAKLKEIFDNKSSRQVKLIIPKFKLTKKVSLVDTLKLLGLTEVFASESNLRGISKREKPLKLSHLIHQADVEIDEDGSTAAAATFEVVQTLSLDWFTDEIQFRADHPFLFFILDKSNEIPIFAGKIFNPISQFSPK